ncbi:MAG: hypothetical protein WBJ54_07050, partial [Syntrophorhabdus sp.]
MKSLSQPVRLFMLVIYVGLLLGASRLALGSWLPPTTEKGVWFYSGLAALLLGNLLVSPFFTKPVDSISYAVAAIVALLAVNTWTSEKYVGFDQFAWILTFIYLVVILISGVLSITFNGSK